MSAITFPPLSLSEWQPTRDTLHLYSKFLGKIRGALTPPLPNWWHVSLHAGPTGLFTPPIPRPDDPAAHFSLTLNLTTHMLAVSFSDETHRQTALAGQSPHSLADWTLSTLKQHGLEPDIDRALFAETTIRPYTPRHAANYLLALTAINRTFQQFKASLTGESSPVQLWPHHFDLSLVWFSGREAVVPAGAEGGPEQVGFGFSTGDESLSEAYFYANPWPVPDDILTEAMPDGASWHTAGWVGGLLPYKTVAGAANPQAVLLNFLTAVQQHAANRMK